MKDKKVYSILIIATLIFGLAITAAPTMAGDFNSVYGFLYINDEIAPSGITVKLTFSENPEEITVDTDSNGYFDLGFTGHNWEEGYFSVKYDGKWYTPEGNPSVEIIPEEIGYEIDLHIEIGNNPPNKPSTPTPSNGATDIGTSPTLSVHVSDPDGDSMNVSFFNADGDVQIGTTASDVSNGGTASTTWSSLSPDTTYSWYAVADDGEFTNQSDTWSFKTKADTGGNGNGGNGNGGNGNGGNGNGGNGGGGTPNQPPTANASAGEPYTGTPGENITFDGSLSSDPEGTDLDYRWDFDGDGTYDTEWLENATVIHSYDSEGIFTVILQVKDGPGATDTDETTANILVPNIPPEKPAVTGTHEGNITTTYEFTFMSTDADNDTIQYTIDWGDGSDIETTDFVPNGTQVTLTHTWSVPGNYTIKVTAYDNATHSDIAEYLVSIEAEQEPEEPEPEEYDYTCLILVLILIIILLIVIYLISKRKKPEEKKQPPKKTENNSKKPAKKTGKTNKKPAKKTGKK